MPRTSLSQAFNAARWPETLRTIDLPIFLCPAFLPSRYSLHKRLFRYLDLLGHPIQLFRARCLHSRVNHPPINHPPKKTHQNSSSDHIKLPRQCPGCGAFSQTIDGQMPGFYSPSRKSLKPFASAGFEQFVSKRLLEDRIMEQSLQNVDSKLLGSFIVPVGLPRKMEINQIPLCDRCHNLFHHKIGVSIKHPSIESIEDTISESPHKYNHIYHIIDAADFPMSLIPQLHGLLHLTPQRSRNRRSKTGKFYHSRKNEVSFIITRSDLLAPLKSQVDSLMPYLTSVLRDALGSAGKHIRLGNVRCVSAKRGWWTKELKEEIWTRGGGGWMVGKVNVGKSQLFESIFPKGRRGLIAMNEPLAQGPMRELSFSADLENPVTNQSENLLDCPTPLEGKVQCMAPDEALSLLPPLQPEEDYPVMPLVSSLPGTTASPIRVPFGNGKGELVDLPGLSRGDLDRFIQECHRSSLVMRSRIVPEQQVIKPGQSLLLGGFIRITPKTPGLIVLCYSFTQLSSHVTSTDKATGVQLQERRPWVENIANPGIGDRIKSAGVFPLRWDVTKMRSSPIVSMSAARMWIDKLPYRVFSSDILIEGCGWVELVVQVRKRELESASAAESNTSPLWPEVEVFSPEGRFIAARRPLGAWLLGAPRKSSGAMKRPRRSMQGMKKKIKTLARSS